MLDYEEGRTLIDEAAKTNDLVLRDELLRDASEKLEGFVKSEASKLMQARDAQVHIGKLLLDRGHTAMLLSEEAQDPTKKATKIAEARAAFNQAHEAYAKAVEPLKAEHKKYIGFIEPDDPRAAERDAIYSDAARRDACSRASRITSSARPSLRNPRNESSISRQPSPSSN